MKKIVLSLTMLFTAINVNAQEVYTEIMQLSKKVANDKSKDIETRKIATFKVDELNYMAVKAKELMPDSSARMLDVQAYCMYEFINLYMKRLKEAKKEEDKQVVMTRFTNASLSNSRYNDTDKELVMSYITAPNYITRFSLDTDWEKALADIRKYKW